MAVPEAAQSGDNFEATQASNTEEAPESSNPRLGLQNSPKGNLGMEIAQRRSCTFSCLPQSRCFLASTLGDLGVVGSFFRGVCFEVLKTPHSQCAYCSSVLRGETSRSSIDCFGALPFKYCDLILSRDSQLPAKTKDTQLN